MESITVLVPTRSDDVQDVRLHHTLQSLLFQTLPPAQIIVRDEGTVPCVAIRQVQQFIDLLARRDITTTYHRAQPQGVSVARKDLVGSAGQESWVCFVDDDMVLAPDALERLVDAARSSVSPETVGFVQGQKLEADANRTYVDDINALNGRRPHGDSPFRVWFGDAALLLLSPQALELIPWEIVTRYREEGLGGEDVAITLPIADVLPCYAAPEALGYHLSPEKSRWAWEVPSDLLQLELLRSHVSATTLRHALPHVAHYLDLDGDQDVESV